MPPLVDWPIVPPTHWCGQFKPVMGDQSMTSEPVSEPPPQPFVPHLVETPKPTPAPRSTHTYATMGVSDATFNEVAKGLREAEYGHAFVDEGTIDMHGIALVLRKVK